MGFSFAPRIKGVGRQTLLTPAPSGQGTAPGVPTGSSGPARPSTRRSSARTGTISCARWPRSGSSPPSTAWISDPSCFTGLRCARDSLSLHGGGGRARSRSGNPRREASPAEEEGLERDRRGVRVWKGAFNKSGLSTGAESRPERWRSAVSVFTQIDYALITQSDGPWVAKLAFERTRQSLPANRPRKSVIAQRETRDEGSLTK